MPRLQPPSSADFVTALAELPPGVCPGECDCAAGRAPPPRHGSGRELLTARCQAMSTASYLSRVYPTASTAFERDAKSARRLFDTLDFYYDHGCASQPVACREPGILLRYLPGYEQMLPCSVEQSLCLQRHSGFSPPWTQSLHATGWVEVEHRAFGLGIPAYALPGEGRNAPAGASDFMDAGAAGMWYVLRRGSGIFYDLGKRTAVAPGKNAMMALLLREAARDPQLDEAWRARAQASGLFRTRRLPPAMAPPTAAVRLPAYNGSAGARRDGDRIAATANGSSDCLKMRLRYCRCRYLLSDQWDHAMICIFTATLLSSGPCSHVDGNTSKVVEDANPRFVTAYAEVVDARPLTDGPWDPSEDPARFLMRDPRQSANLGVFTLRKTAAAAEQFVERMRRSSRLTLRDPFHVADGSRAAPCNFSVHDRLLGCASHVSALWPRGAYRRCGHVMCGQKGLWVGGRAAGSA